VVDDRARQRRSDGQNVVADDDDVDDSPSARPVVDRFRFHVRPKPSFVGRNRTVVVSRLLVVVSRSRTL